MLFESGDDNRVIGMEDALIDWDITADPDGNTAHISEHGLSQEEIESVLRDPNNILFTRGPRARVDAETVRDAALRASGLLTEKIGGPSVFPPQVAGITTEGAYGPLQWKVS